MKLQWICRALLPLLLLAAGTVSAQVTGRNFDHLTTGFELTGAHRLQACETCHVDAVFAGTPRVCAACHAQRSRIGATPKPSAHVASTDNCGACHTTSGWIPAGRFDHLEARGDCATCHDGLQAQGKPAGHLTTSQECSSCHSNTAWSPAKYNHSGITGVCASCHDGVKATGKRATHPQTTSSCESCHTIAAWAPISRIDHTQVSGSCASCHDGTSATGKHALHVLTTAACASRHAFRMTSASWVCMQCS